MHEFVPYRAEKTYSHFSVVYGRAPSGSMEAPGSITAENSFDMAFLPHRHALVRRASGRVEKRSFAIGQGGMHGLEPVEFIETDAPSEYMEIRVDPQLLYEAEYMPQTGASLELPERYDLIDPVMWAVCSRLRACFLQGWPLDPIEAESLLLLLTSHLAVHYLKAKAPRQTRLRLSLITLRRVNDYIDAKLNDTISIKELASQAALSPFQFIRAFKASTGLTPYEFVLCKRIERARCAIQLNQQTIAEAAALVGYKNTVHFRKAFRRYLGVNPSDIVGSAWVLDDRSR